MSNVDALKALYTALGGSAETVAGAETIVEMLNAIAAKYSGDDDAELNADAIANITAVVTAITEPPLQDRTVTPTTSKQTIQKTTSSYYGLGKVTVNAVTAAIDANITAGNIKSGVTILGVEGTYTGD